jgi:hypothetical protein
MPTCAPNAVGIYFAQLWCQSQTRNLAKPTFLYSTDRTDRTDPTDRMDLSDRGTRPRATLGGKCHPCYFVRHAGLMKRLKCGSREE